MDPDCYPLLTLLPHQRLWLLIKCVTVPAIHCFWRKLPQYSNVSRLGKCLWQVFILDSLATYRPRDSKDAESIVERVTPRLQHANCAVVLSAVKVCVTAAFMPCGTQDSVQLAPVCRNLCVIST